MEYGLRAVVVLMHANLGLDEMRPNATARDLQPQALERHRIIVADDTVLLDTEHVVPCMRATGTKALPGSAAATANRAL